MEALWQWNGRMEAQNGDLEGLYCRPVATDFHHFDEEQNPDPH